MESNWTEKQKIILSRLYNSDSYSSEFKKMIIALNENLISKKFGQEILWIAYRLLDEETKNRYLKYLIFYLLFLLIFMKSCTVLELIPLELNEISDYYKHIIENGVI